MIFRRWFSRFFCFDLNWPSTWLFNLGLLAFWGWALKLAYQSLDWPIFNDLATMAWYAFLIKQFHILPYLNYSDINFPGTHLIYWIIGSLSGFSEFQLHIADLCLLGLTLLGVGWLLKPWGKAVSAVGIIACALVYFSYGFEITLERDCFLALLLIWSLVAALRFRLASDFLRWFIIGGLWSGIALIKPHALIMVPAILFMGWCDLGQKKSPFHARVNMLLGLVSAGGIAAVITVFVMARLGILSPFIQGLGILKAYHGTYVSSLPDTSGVSHVIDVLLSFAGANLNSAELVEHSLLRLFFPAIGTVMCVLALPKLPSRLKHESVLLISLIGLAWLYVLIGNRFYYYHYLVMMVLLICLGAMIISEAILSHFQKPPWRSAVLQAGVLVWLGMLAWTPPFGVVGVRSSNSGLEMFNLIYHVDSLVSYFSTNSHPGDTIQGFFGNNHLVHYVALKTSLRPATRYLSEVELFGLNPSQQKQNRERFYAEWCQNPPDFAVGYRKEHGKHMPEIEPFLARDYEITYSVCYPNSGGDYRNIIYVFKRKATR